MNSKWAVVCDIGCRRHQGRANHAERDEHQTVSSQPRLAPTAATRLRAGRAHRRHRRASDGALAVYSAVLPSLLQRYAPHEGLAGDCCPRPWSLPALDGIADIRVAALPAEGALL